MARWKSTVHLTDLHDAHRNGTMTIQEVGKQLAIRLKSNMYAKHDLLDEIEELEDGVEDVDHYDSILHNIYDFGDYGHRIWIETIGGRK